MIVPLLVGAGLVYLLMKKSGTPTQPVAPSPSSGGSPSGPPPNQSVGGTSGASRGVYPINPKVPTGPTSDRDVRPARLGFTRNTLQCGGGGPENRGAKSTQDYVVDLPTTQPSWWHEADDEYTGYATKSHVPITAGGGLGQPADAARWLGDNFKGRQ